MPTTVHIKRVSTYCCLTILAIGLITLCSQGCGSTIPNANQPPNADAGPDVDKSVDDTVDLGASASSDPKLQLTLGDGVTMEMVLIPAGTFMMGSPDGQGESTEHPQHQVTISRAFYMGKYEVTQAQWRAIMGTNPSLYAGDNLPVELVSWDDCQTFCQQASIKTGLTVRIPTEAQWEYACRAGTTTTYYFGDDVSQLGQYSWYGDNSGGQTHDVGGKLPNAWGLYDMHGNVWEWCQDLYGAYSAGSQTDPTGPSTGSSRVLRGGSWYYYADYLRCAGRSYYGPGYRYVNYGFRLAMD